MAPPRHHHHHNSHAHQNSGSGGSPFPPLGLAAASSPLHHSAFSSSHEANSHHDAVLGSDAATGLPPAPHKVDASQAQACRLQDAYWSDEEEDMDCPLCLEEIDISDANFKPCPCGYQICRFCWHHIKQNLNGRCPACRRKYSDNSVEFKAMSQDEIKRLAQAKKQKEREKKELEQMNRKHLANMRVVQKNLVYVVGLDPKLAKEELIPTLRSNEFFGQYGRISKILISKRTTASKLVMGTQESAIGVYVTYVRKEDAARAIVAIDGSKGPDGKTIRASYGTTKYCTNYLRNLPCTNNICTYLHEPGEEADSFTKEDLSTLRHAAKDTEHKSSRPIPPPASFSTAGLKAPQQQQQPPLQQQQQEPPPVSTPSSIAAVAEAIEASALPKTASWASGRPGGVTSMSSGNVNASSQSGHIAASPGGLRDQDLPPLSAIQQQNTRKASGRATSASTAKNASATKTKLANVPGAATAANGSTEAHRSESPLPLSNVAASMAAAAPNSASASPMSASPPLPAPPPGLFKMPPRAPSAVQDGAQRTSSQNTGEENAGLSLATESVPPPAAPPALPPGLAKRASQASQSSRPATPSQPHDTADNSQSTYQPSSRAQALLDDMTSRRAAEASQPAKSPFPDFDAMLSHFRDGDDFCFTLEESQIPASMKEARSGSGSAGFSAFAPFGHNQQPQLYYGQGSAATPPPPPPGIATPNKSRTHSPAPFHNSGFLEGDADGGRVYSGTFDPFAPGAVDVLSSNLDRFTSPLGNVEGLRHGLEEEQNVQSNGRNASLEVDDDTRPSRFGFSKRRESPYFKTHDDLLGFVKGGARARMMDGDNGQMGGQNNESYNWLPNGSYNNGQGHSSASGSSAFQGGANISAGGVREDPLLAQLINNHRPVEGLPYNDPAIMSFTRQQQQQQQHQQQQLHQHHQQSAALQQHQRVSPQDTYGSGFNPFDSAPANGYQQQPYTNHRTFV